MIESTWSDIKSKINLDGTHLFFSESPRQYTVWISVAGASLFTEIPKSRARNSTQKDFENNYKSTANPKTVANSPQGVYYRLQDDDTAAVTYIGESLGSTIPLESEAMWRISRIFSSGSSTITEFASSGLFDQVWDDRSTIFPAPPFGNEFSVKFDGVNDFISGDDVHELALGNSSSYSMWIKTNTFAVGGLVSKASVGLQGYYIMTTAAAKIKMEIITGGAWGSYTTTATMTTGDWHHVVVTYSGANNMNGVNFYIDNGKETPGSSSLSGDPTNSEMFRIGSINATNYFNGWIDEVSIWNKELSAAEVSEIYNGGSPTDVNLHSASANLASFYRMGDNDDYPTFYDNRGSNNLVANNMLSTAIREDAP